MDEKASVSGRILDYAPMSYVERIHTEAKTTRAEYERRIDTLEAHRAQMDVQIKHIEELLKNIATAIDGLRPKWWVLVGLFVPVLAMGGGYVWQASKYPDRTEFVNVVAALTARLTTVEINSAVDHALVQHFTMKINP